MQNNNKIMILCKVVDNFGDIGVVYRLARSLSDLRPELELTLVVSNLESFHKMASAIDPNKQIQDFKYKNSTWKIIDWNLKTKRNADLLTPSNFPFSIILECFQCGRPDWLENLLFSDDFTETVQILNIDYLTAEDYAEDFHLLKSGTRKANIKKRFFMPGFTEKTGGLVINEVPSFDAKNPGASAKAAALSALPLSLHSSVRAAHSGTPSGGAPIASPSSFNIFFFAYEDDCTAVVQGISQFQETICETEQDFSVTVFVADGKSSIPFENAWKKINSPFKIEKIPFLQQEEFDFFINQMDFLFVRGEDSLARAALSGLPYIWQAYKQDENYQLVKVNALLDQMESYFSENDFREIKSFWQSYNDYENPTDSDSLTKMLISSRNQKNTEGFRRFSQKLHKNGNLAEHLLAFIDSL
ncbi:elongation factor P maturation arginine rhamnosyltransferase EarP [uncultured Treponema sp.]|uniref:elongation factor P maturation arginine rhamnosyltransferase EarP n=1 Tax=uncultured Treponema sp. TaxID=162155 RepID=UPI0025E04B06|nr:elongation factor P maturation arginine rhamnosyltransferase EarP [uncultured Treponema sp.]